MMAAFLFGGRLIMANKVKNTVVVKIGTSSLTDAKGNIMKEKINTITEGVAKLKNNGHKIIIVTSGSIAAGFRLLGYNERPKTVTAKQASAAAGQGLLIEEYTRSLNKHGYVAAQVLLTRDDFSDRRRFKNAASTLEILINKGAVPIINENDTVSIEELKFGDNDSLSAHVAAMVHADLLLILTDIDGVYDSNPRENPEAKRIDYIGEITKEIEIIAGGSGSTLGTGGMKSKIVASKIATSWGVPVLITSSAIPDVIYKAVEEKVAGSYFEPQKRRLNNKRQWMTFYSLSKGSLYVDKGASDALEKDSKSLLPKGILKVSGDFNEGDVVEVYGSGRRLIGKGIVNFSSLDLDRIKGLSSKEIKDITGHNKTEAINRSNWIENNIIKKEGI